MTKDSEEQRIVPFPGHKEAPEGPTPKTFNDKLDLSLLMHGKKGPLLHSRNVKLALRNTPCWEGAFAYDELKKDLVLIRETPAGFPGYIGKKEMSRIHDWMLKQGFNVQPETVELGVYNYAISKSFHPIRTHLKSLNWDGKARLDTWLITYCGAKDTPYTRAVGRAWMISGVARAMEPGCRVDTMLILEGRQGAKKSTAISTLGYGEREDGRNWFTDHVPQLGDKDANEVAVKFWIIECAELNALSKAEASQYKSFLSRKVENYRPPFGKKTEPFPRECVFAGTVNPDADGYLKDTTGARRFWPVAVQDINIEALKEDRDQLWAEAYHYWKKKEKWWLEGALEEAALEEQDERQRDDPWTEAVKKAVDKVGNFIAEEPDKDGKLATVVVNGRAVPKSEYGYTIDDILAEIQPDRARWNHSDSIRIGNILRWLGYLPRRIGPRGHRRRIYRKAPE